MVSAVILYASAGYGYGGKQYIARIVGRDPKFTFARTFIGKKVGKRAEQAEATVDEPGLFERRDIDKKGRDDDSYLFVWLDGETARTWPVSKDEAMGYAKRLEKNELAQDLAKEAIILELRRLIEDGSLKDQDEMIQLRGTSAEMIGLDPLEKHARRDVIAARQAFVRRIDVTHAEEVGAELAEIKSELLIEELKKRGFRVVTPRAAKAKPEKPEMGFDGASAEAKLASAALDACVSPLAPQEPYQAQRFPRAVSTTQAEVDASAEASVDAAMARAYGGDQ